MPLMNAMRIVESKHAAIVSAPKMRQEKGKVISDDLTALVNPALLSKDACSTGTSKVSLVIVFFVQASSTSHLVSYHRRCA
jgi:hypothetical protein